VAEHLSRPATGVLFEGADSSVPLPGSMPTAAMDRISPNRMREFAVASGVRRLVLVVPRLAARRQALVADARRAGFGVGEVELLASEDVAVHSAVLVVAVARLVERRATVPPEAVRLTLPSLAAPLDRRSLLGGLRLQQTVVPLVAQERCLAWNGCDVCLGACPAGAIARHGSTVAIEPADCANCGICVPACPAQAIEHPLFPTAGLDAALRALLSGPVPATVAFSCPEIVDKAATARARSVVPFPALPAGLLGWLWPLRALDLGAAAVLVAACPRCLESASAAFRGLQGLLAGWKAEGRLRVTAGAPDSASLETLGHAAAPVAGPPASRLRLADVILSLWAKLGCPETDPSLLPFRAVSIDAGACTLCGLCAGRCPSGALQLDQDAQRATITFAAGDCSGCGLCLRACPEQALGLATPGPLADMAKRTVLAHSPMTACPGCGRPGNPEALVERVLAKVGSGPAAIHGRLCAACRDAALMATPRPQPARLSPSSEGRDAG